MESISLSAKSYVYNKKRHTPKVTITDKKGKVLQRDIDYTLTYPKGRKAVGTYQIKVAFIGKYAGTKTVKYKILPGVLSGLTAKAGSRSAKLSWKAVPGATHYVVYYSNTKKGGYEKLGRTTNTYANMLQLESGKRYYFRVRPITVKETGQWNGPISAPIKVIAK